MSYTPSISKPYANPKFHSFGLLLGICKMLHDVVLYVEPIAKQKNGEMRFCNVGGNNGL